MLEEVISNIINTTIASFDFPYCVIVNLLTYITIKCISTYKSRYLGTWSKRLIFFIVSILVATVYCSNGSDYKIIFNVCEKSEWFFACIIFMFSLEN